ncbi:OmpA family protein [Mariprofundus erugo]|uniref:OmpA family protein n=1 Tax=Mariprofundus erugo TaxID=2528639 RepID=UPI0010FF28F3|nr:OmpA family protein [Mariprofundus erugo]TLS75785.1 OmpA family protein [Mariprofundus erugo]
MFRLRFVLLATLLTLSSCSTIDAIFGPPQPEAPVVSAADSQLASENQQLQSEVATLRDSLQQMKQEIEDKKAEQLASQAAAEQAAAAEAVVPEDRLWVTVSFRSGHMELTPQSRKALKELAGKFLAKPRTQTIAVRGYTDDEPIGGYPGHRHKSRHPYKTNEALSQARAENVARALVDAGIPAESVHAEGLGATNFVADNTTDEGRQKNRRAEIHLVKG